MGRKATDLTGMRVGKLVVLERAYSGRAKEGRPFWKCICDCGKETIVSSNHLKKQIIKSCGCGIYRNDLVGKKFGRLLVTEKLERTQHQQMWLCKCDCGKTCKKSHSALVGGRVVSCGCFHKEQLTKRQTTHGMSKTRLYSIYYNMKRRCNNPSDARYIDYGGRGIKICPSWDSSFDIFMGWALLNGYSDNKSIDRIDNNKGYFPENCQWISMEEQRDNTRRSINIELFGVEKTLHRWCQLMEWNYSKHHARYRRGKTVFTENELLKIEQKLKE